MEVPELTLIGVHLPHKKLQIPYFEALDALQFDSDTEFMLAVGDFNCGIPFADSQTASFYATRWFQRLLDKDWVDVWRSRNPKAREFSWISTKKKSDLGTITR